MKEKYSINLLMFNWMVEIGTIFVFWIVFQLYGLMSAILWTVVATIITVGLAVFIQQRYPLFPLVMCFVVTLFGGYSLITKEPSAFVFQHTLYYGIGGILLVIGLMNGKSVLKPLFDNLFSLTDRGWLILAKRWSFFFILVACGNEWVWRTMSESAWASYKLGMTISVTIFGLSQLRLARRERLPDASGWGFKIR